MAVHIGGHLYRCMAEPRLHHLERQFEPAIEAPVDAHEGVEVAERVQALDTWASCPPPSSTPAAICAGQRPRSTIEFLCSMPLRLFAKTMSPDHSAKRRGGALLVCSSPSAATARYVRPPPTSCGRSCRSGPRAGGRGVRRPADRRRSNPQPAKLRGAQPGEDRGQKQGAPACGIGDDGELADDPLHPRPARGCRCRL